LNFARLDAGVTVEIRTGKPRSYQGPGKMVPSYHIVIVTPKLHAVQVEEVGNLELCKTRDCSKIFMRSELQQQKVGDHAPKEIGLGHSREN
jgi:hypothetical protein